MCHTRSLTVPDQLAQNMSGRPFKIFPLILTITPIPRAYVLTCGRSKSLVTGAKSASEVRSNVDNMNVEITAQFWQELRAKDLIPKF